MTLTVGRSRLTDRFRQRCTQAARPQDSDRVPGPGKPDALPFKPALSTRRWWPPRRRPLVTAHGVKLRMGVDCCHCQQVGWAGPLSITTKNRDLLFYRKQLVLASTMPSVADSFDCSFRRFRRATSAPFSSRKTEITQNEIQTFVLSYVQNRAGSFHRTSSAPFPSNGTEFD